MIHDVCIIGGGLAGLALALNMRRNDHSVVVIEKGKYPRNKVCGEYLSSESRDYLFGLCPELADIELPLITKFELTSTGKAILNIPLASGGIGISRYLLEMKMYRRAINEGVIFYLNTKAGLSYAEGPYYVTPAGGSRIQSRLVCNAAGRYSGVGRKSDPGYIGVKYHVQLKRDPSLIQIHNFPGGYCGISSVEDDVSCLCYIIDSSRVRVNGNSILKAEQNVLFQNPRLEKIFNTATFLQREPLTISGIHFKAGEPFADGVFYLGDSAGTIAPITGNGMSMGLRAAKQLSGILTGQLRKEYSLQKAAEQYSAVWRSNFQTRINVSRYFQMLSQHTVLTRAAISGLKYFPAVSAFLVRQTHGTPF